MASIIKRNGSYMFMVSCGYDVHGKQVRRTMTYTPEPGMTAKQIEKEVQRQAILFEEKCKTGQAAESGCMKLSEFIEMYFESHAELNLKKKTIVGYRNMAKIVNKGLGHLRIDRITPQQITLFYRNQLKRGVRRKVYYHCQINLKKLVKDRGYATEPLAQLAGMAPSTLRDALNGHDVSEKTAAAICKALKLPMSRTFTADGKDKPLSNNTVRHYHSFLSSVLGVAVKWGLIPSNPCERATLPKKEKTPPRYLDEEQAARLLSLLDGEDVQYRTMIKMFMFTGMRREELCGLEWKDIDFKTSVIRIERASLYIPHEGIITETTKNDSSTRYIKAPAVAIQLLKEYKRWQAQKRLSMGDRWVDCDRLFTKPDGMPIHPDTIGCWFRDFIRAHDLPDISIHSLRHTNATLMINSGIPLTTIAARLGHADPTTTSKIYVHAIQSADAAAAEQLDLIFTNRTANIS
jgi:integrase